MTPSTGWALVGLQFGVLAALVVIPAGDLWARGTLTFAIAGVLVIFGVVVGVLGGVRLGSTLTPLPIPKDDGELVTTGIYGWVRHPIYFGLLLVGAGIAVAGASALHLVGWALLWAVLMLKASWEEKMLNERYPDYRLYSARVGRIIPRVGRQHGFRGKR
jgi:protein-S-isoprenylcysteine O-methyltransferase Ste14